MSYYSFVCGTDNNSSKFSVNHFFTGLTALIYILSDLQTESEGEKVESEQLGHSAGNSGEKCGGEHE